jgi:hypothetical protein
MPARLGQPLPSLLLFLSAPSKIDLPIVPQKTAERVGPARCHRAVDAGKDASEAS